MKTYFIYSVLFLLFYSTYSFITPFRYSNTLLNIKRKYNKCLTTDETFIEDENNDYKPKRRSKNVEGNLYVDDSCIDCDACRWICPSSFSRVGIQAAVTKQPETAVTITLLNAIQ
jgi:formate hydrogenlyase subunit 6/NADH:ubiquinone oxidoreductase subunit I